MCVLCFFLGFFFSVRFDLFILFLFYLLSFCYYFLDASLFSKEKQKGLDPEGSGGENRRSKGRGKL